MTLSDPLFELRLLIQSRHSIIVLEGSDLERSPELLRGLARTMGIMFYRWSPSKGLLSDKNATIGVIGTAKVQGAFQHIEACSVPAVYYFEPNEDWQREPVVISHLRDAAEKMVSTRGAIIIAADSAQVPDILRSFTAVYRIPDLRHEEYLEHIRRIVLELRQVHHAKNELTDADLEILASNARGMTLSEIRRMLTRAVLDDGRFSKEDLKHAFEAKKAAVEKSGLLEFYASQDRIADLAGLKGLKAWLEKRKNFFKDRAAAKMAGLEFPKGILLLGVQGCGKSLCAKVVASDWGLPLLKLDASRIYNKYVGESEKNFSQALSLAEKISPCVLWIDEIEKAFATEGGESDGGTTQRIFGTFLTWMQERKGDVFIVATANNIEKLPPEFLRKGRFDEIFFVDLPSGPVRRSILEIHLRRKKQDPARFSLDELVRVTEGFSGAEIDQAIISALYTCFSGGSPLDTDSLLREIRQTKPLSVVMAPKISALREWSKERTVSAD